MQAEKGCVGSGGRMAERPTHSQRRAGQENVGPFQSDLMFFADRWEQDLGEEPGFVAM